MSERLTLANSCGEDGKFCEGCEHFGEPNGCNKAGGECEPYLNHQDIYQRLFDIESILYDKDDNEVISLTRLRELAEAKREGRVVVLPCRVTDLLYVIYSPKHPANPSDKGKWFMATAQVNRIKLGVKGFSMESWMGSFAESEIGKTVFFTQAEAERALAATEPKGGLDGK